MSPRVCVMTSAHPPSDVRIFHKQCKSLARAGYEVILVAPADASGRCDGVEVRHVDRSDSRLRRILFTTRAVYRAARDARAEVYHFHDPELIPAGLLLRLRGKQVIYDIHEDLPRTFSYKPYIPKWLVGILESLVDFSEKIFARGFSALIAASPEIAARFRSHPRVAVVQNYPRLEEFQVDRASAPRSRKSGYVVYVGLRITRARGAEEMVRAMGLLPDNIPVRLKLVGTIEPPELLAQLQSLDGWKRTDYLGPLDREGVADVLRGASVGLVVLHPEPNYLLAHPVKLFEYMCAGIPVIASDFPVCRQVVQPSGCGLLVDPQNPREIASAIDFLCCDPQRAAEMGSRGREAVLTRYNWSAEERILLELYRRLRGARVVYDELKAEAT